MNPIFLVTDTRIDQQKGSTNHVLELFENLQEFSDVFLIAPWSETEPTDDRILSIRGDVVPVPYLQTLLFRTAFVLFLGYHTLRRSPAAFYLRHSLLAFVPATVAKAFGVPLVVEVNGPLIEEHDSTGKRPWLTKALRLSEWVHFRLADRFVAVTPKIADYIHQQYGVPEERIAHVSNGANVDMFTPLDEQRCKDELGLDRDATYVTFVGNLAPWQGVEYLLESAPSVLAEVPEAQFLIVGDGIQREELQQQVSELDLEDDVEFTGMVPYDDVPRYVNASDVCVVYKTPMGYGYSPLKLYEYMACGRPVVASDTDGFEILEESEAGVLVEPENPDALADELVELLRDEPLRETMGENGREYVVEHRSWRATAENVADVIERAIEEERVHG